MLLNHFGMAMKCCCLRRHSMKVGARQDMARRIGRCPGLEKELMDPLRLSQTVADV
jgi:hypothetical protein